MRARTYTDRQGRVTDTPEWIRQQFGKQPRSPQQQTRDHANDRKYLKRIETPEARRFARENPDAGREDYQRYQRQQADVARDRVRQKVKGR